MVGLLYVFPSNRHRVQPPLSFPPLRTLDINDTHIPIALSVQCLISFARRRRSHRIRIPAHSPASTTSMCIFTASSQLHQLHHRELILSTHIILQQRLFGWDSRYLTVVGTLCIQLHVFYCSHLPMEHTYDHAVGVECKNDTHDQCTTTLSVCCCGLSGPLEAAC